MKFEVDFAQQLDLVSDSLCFTKIVEDVKKADPVTEALESTSWLLFNIMFLSMISDNVFWAIALETCQPPLPVEWNLASIWAGISNQNGLDIICCTRLLNESSNLRSAEKPQGQILEKQVIYTFQS